MSTVTVLPGRERRRRWTPPEKQRIVEESLTADTTVAEVARRHDIHPNLLRSWIKAFEADPQEAFPGQGRMKPEQAEIERLRREVQKLKAERDILKKAAAYFAKESK